MIRILTFILVLLLNISAHSQKVVYVYGDVSAHGQVPSGEAPPFHQMRLNDTGNLGMSGFKQALEAVGLSISEVYDADITINKAFLSNIDVLILASNQRVFSAKEAKAIRNWVKKGGGLIGWSDSAFGGEYSLVGLDNDLGRTSDNAVFTQFGMYFLTDNGAGNYLVKNYTQDHYINNYQKNGGVAFRGEGVSFIRVSPPAQVLALAQEGGLGGRLTVNKKDGVFNPKTDVALAIAEVGKGRVLAVFDRNLFWNAGAGTRLSHSDNRAFAQRIALWAAALEDEERTASDTLIINTNRLNTPPVVTINHTFDPVTSSLTIVTEILDNDDDSLHPEIRWRQVKGPASVTFENNNPNTPTPRIFLSEKGKYVFRAEVLDGEFRIVRFVTYILE